MASISSPPPQPLTPEEFSGMLAAHRRWLRSGGQEGQKAELSGANLAGLDLDGYDLSGLDFREANLARVRFGDALVEGASFRAADLQEADLSKARGLLAPQLAGADLAGARLPEDIQEFAGLKHVDAASSHVQRLFFLLLLVCVYCWLTIAVTTDANLLNNFAEQPLPIIGTKINLVMFYWAAPFLLLCGYLYFHLCLQRLWEALAELPAIFPDGLPLPHRVHPWLWNGLVWAYFPRLRDRRPPLLLLQKVLAILLVWWAGPLTLLALWFRYLPAHDWTITILQLVFLTLALDGALGFSLLTRATLLLKEKRPSHGKRLWRTVKGMTLLLTTVGIAGLFYLCSLAAIEGVSDLPFLAAIDSFHGRPWVSAYLIGADVSLKPPQWTGKPGDIDLVRGANLQDRNLRGARASKAFLVKADLEGANLQQADLKYANLQKVNLSVARMQGAILLMADLQQAELSGANLQQANLFDADLRQANLNGAKLQQAILMGAKLQQATLYGADLRQADLFGADLQQAKLYNAKLQQANLDGVDFQGAEGLERDQVLAASKWQLAKYSQDLLNSLQLPPGHNKNIKDRNLSGYILPRANLRVADFRWFNLRDANLQGADLEEAEMTEADLTGADLRGANLREAKYLTREQLESAILDENTKLPDDLKDLVPSGSQKP